MLDTREYVVQIQDGSSETYSANLIAESIMSSVDEEGNSYVLMDEIIDHQKGADALSREDALIRTKSGVRSKITTKGWEFLVSWKDGTQSWVRLADIKDSFPIEVAKCVVANQSSEEPAFNWWVPKVLRKKEQMVCVAKSRTKYWLKSHKYGVRLPKTIKEALQIDKETGTDYWRKEFRRR